MADSLTVTSDPYLDYALRASAYPRAYTAPQDATYVAPRVSSSQTYVEPSDSGNGLVTGLVVGGTIIGAGALIYEGYKHGDGKGIWAGLKKMFGAAGEAITGKATRAMKEFTYFTKDGHKIVVKDGKVVEIFKKGADRVERNAAEINKFLRGEKISGVNPWRYGNKIQDGFKLTQYTTKFNGDEFVINKDGDITKIISKGKEIRKKKDIEKYLENLPNRDALEERINKIADGSFNNAGKGGMIYDVSYEYTASNGTVYTNKLLDSSGRTKQELLVPGEYSSRTLSEADRKAYLQSNPDVDLQVSKLIEDGRFDGVKAVKFAYKDDAGNEYIIKNGEIVEIIEKRTIGRNKVYKKGSTEFGSWLYDHKSVQEAIKKEIESGLGTNGATFRWVD